MRSWYLDFRIKPQSPTLKAIVSAIEAGLGVSLSVTSSGWIGNPRESYWQSISGSAEVPARGTLNVVANLGGMRARRPGVVEKLDASSIQVVVSGDDVPAMLQLWERLTGTLGALGYADKTLIAAPADIVDALAEVGEVERVASLRQEITAALVEKIASGPDHWPLVVSFSRPDDLDRVLRAAPCPEQVRSIALSGCGLTRLPSLLLNEPGFFPALESLDLTWNPLESLPPLKADYPKLTHVGLEHCPPLALDLVDWKGVTLAGR